MGSDHFGSKPDVDGWVGEHYASLYTYAYRLSGSSQDAEDLVQETFLTAQTKSHQLRAVDHPRNWLRTILRNHYLMRCRQTVPTLFDPDNLPDSVEQIPQLESAVDEEWVQRALLELPETFRTPLLLHYFDAMTYREIADWLGVPVGTVMSRLARAKHYLRRRLAPPTPSLPTAVVPATCGGA